MHERENNKISEKEKVSSWLEKQIQIWNGASISKLSNRDRFPHLSSNIKVERNISEFRVNKPDDEEKKENNKQETCDNVSKRRKDEVKRSDNSGDSRGSSMRLKFKDWSDLHNYLLISLKQKQVKNI